MHWSEDQLLASTPYALSCAYIGHCKAKGLGRWEVKADGWSDVELEDWREVEAALKEQYPESEAPKGWKKMKRHG